MAIHPSPFPFPLSSFPPFSEWQLNELRDLLWKAFVDKYYNFGRPNWQQISDVLLIDSSNFRGTFEGVRSYWQMIDVVPFHFAEVETIKQWTFCWRKPWNPKTVASHYSRLNEMPHALWLFCFHSFECQHLSIVYRFIRSDTFIMSRNELKWRHNTFTCLMLRIPVLYLHSANQPRAIYIIFNNATNSEN